MLLYASEQEIDSNLLCVYDDGSSIDILNNELLFYDDTIVEAEHLVIQNSSSTYDRVRCKGSVLGFGECYFDRHQFCNILCAYNAERNDNLCVVEIKDEQNGKRKGYNVEIKGTPVVLKFRWCNKVMLGSLLPLYNYLFENQGAKIFAMKTFKSKKHLQTMARFEKAVRAVRGIQHKLGFQSDDHASISIDRGYFKNVPINSKDFKLATVSYGPDVPMSKGKGIFSRKIEMEDMVSSLKEGECSGEADIHFIGKHAFLMTVIQPTFYGVLVYLGDKTGDMKGDKLKEAIGHTSRIVSKYGWKLVSLIYDGEKSIGGDKLDIGRLRDEIFDAYGIRCKSLDPGVHAKHVERKCRHWKDKLRSLNFKSLFCIPPSLVPQLGIAGMTWCNMDPTTSNVNMAPPLVLMTGETIDYNKMCVATFGDYVLASEDHGVTHSSTEKERKSELLYLFPNDTSGSHKLFSLDSLEKGKGRAYPSRSVKHKDVQKYVPMHVIARLNRQALKERSAIKGMTPEQATDLDEMIGYREDLVINVAPELIARSPVTTSHIDVGGEEAAQPDGATVVTTFESKKKIHHGDFINFMIATEGIGISDESRELMFATRKEVDYRKAKVEVGNPAVSAMHREFAGLVKKKTFHPVQSSKLTAKEIKKALPGRGFVKPKPIEIDPTNWKGRFVADGSRQKHSDYDIYKMVSSPAAYTTSLFSVAAHAAAKKKAVMCFDWELAYLNADQIGEKVHVLLDAIYVKILKHIDKDTDYTPFIRDDGKMYVQLDKALYGCIQSARAWFEHLKAAMIDLGYKQNPYDPCVFNLFNEKGEIIVTVVYHVDDGFAAGDSEKDLDRLQKQLLQKFNNEIKFQRGRKLKYLSMIMDFTEDYKVLITMSEYTENLVKSWKIEKKREVPAKPNLFEVDEESPLLDKQQKKELHKGIAQLLWLAIRTRPEILCPAIFLTSRVQDLRQQDLKKFLDVLEYLNNTIELGIILGAEKDGTLKVSVYADASFGVHMDGKSHGATVISYGRGAIQVQSGKIKTTAKASAEAELYQLSDGISNGVGALEFAKAQQFVGPNDSGIVHEDNKSTIHLLKNGRSTSNRTRHIKIRYFFVKQYLDSGEFILCYCPTAEMIADILTKPLQRSDFLRLRPKLLGYDYMQ